MYIFVLFPIARIPTSQKSPILYLFLVSYRKFGSKVPQRALQSKPATTLQTEKGGVILKTPSLVFSANLDRFPTL
uniref:Uncharacterized protein n=1 Tax=Rhizophora mucronata TaxID=61149 RepID=A0A2P2KM88_RHIMU